MYAKVTDNREVLDYLRKEEYPKMQRFRICVSLKNGRGLVSQEGGGYVGRDPGGVAGGRMTERDLKETF